MHQAYNFALGFDDQLVTDILERFEVKRGQSVLDPFSGTGTTLVECKKRGIRSLGLDANPVCVLIAKAKVDWGIRSATVESSLEGVRKKFNLRYAAYLRSFDRKKAAGHYYSPLSHPLFTDTETGRFLIDSGILKRGWMSPRPAFKTLLLATVIQEAVGAPRIRRFLMTSLLGLLVPEISNMRYGPEIYKAVNRRDVDVIDLFCHRVLENIDVLSELRSARTNFPSSEVRLGDSVNGGLRKMPARSLNYVITSPPYPCEHDYTRLTRLELIFGGYVSHAADIRVIKKRLIRCCTRNIYSGDDRYKDVSRFGAINSVVRAIEREAENYTHGFARLYSRVVEEYFGGMYQHFQEVARVLRRGSRCAYIVGDQASFFSIQIKTAEILSRLANSKNVGLREVDSVRLRPLRGSCGAKSSSNHEWLLILEKK